MAEAETKKKALEEAAKKDAADKKRRASEAAAKAAAEEEKSKKEDEAKKKEIEASVAKAEGEAKAKVVSAKALVDKAGKDADAKVAEAEKAVAKAEKDADAKIAAAKKKKDEEKSRQRNLEMTRLKEKEAALEKIEENKRKVEDARKILANASKIEEEAKKRVEEVENMDFDISQPAEEGTLPLAAYYLEKYLGIDNAADEIVASFNEIVAHPEKSRNIVILGRYGFGSVCVGEDFARSYFDIGLSKSKVIAKIRAQGLNKLADDKLEANMAKLAGGCLVVENAGLIKPERLKKVVELGKQERYDYGIALTGEIDSIAKIFADCKSVVPEFNHLIQLDEITNDEMFNVAFGYILQRGYTGIENIEAKLRNLFLAMETGNLDRLLKSVDDAIERCDVREKKAGGEAKKTLIADDFQ